MRNVWPAAKSPGCGQVQRIWPCGSTMSKRLFNLSATSTGPGRTFGSDPGIRYVGAPGASGGNNVEPEGTGPEAVPPTEVPSPLECGMYARPDARAANERRPDGRPEEPGYLPAGVDPGLTTAMHKSTRTTATADTMSRRW